MSPLRKRIAYKKKSGFPIFRYLIVFIVIITAGYLLFYHRFENKTVYERVVGFFKSEVEKSPSSSIIDADKEIKNIVRKEQHKEKATEKENTGKKPESDKDEIEEVIRKKLEGK